MEVAWNRGTPSSQPFLDGMFHYKPSFFGVPLWLRTPPLAVFFQDSSIGLWNNPQHMTGSIIHELIINQSSSIVINMYEYQLYQLFKCHENAMKIRKTNRGFSSHCSHDELPLPTAGLPLLRRGAAQTSDSSRSGRGREPNGGPGACPWLLPLGSSHEIVDLPRKNGDFP